MNTKQTLRDSVTLALVDAIAAAEGVPASDLGYSLGDYIDLDCIEGLAANRYSNWTLQFSVPDHTVTIDSEGTIVVDDTEIRWV